MIGNYKSTCANKIECEADVYRDSALASVKQNKNPKTPKNPKTTKQKPPQKRPKTKHPQLNTKTTCHFKVLVFPSLHV